MCVGEEGTAPMPRASGRACTRVCRPRVRVSMRAISAMHRTNRPPLASRADGAPPQPRAHGPGRGRREHEEGLLHVQVHDGLDELPQQVPGQIRMLRGPRRAQHRASCRGRECRCAPLALWFSLSHARVTRGRDASRTHARGTCMHTHVCAFANPVVVFACGRLGGRAAGLQLPGHLVGVADGEAGPWRLALTFSGTLWGRRIASPRMPEASHRGPAGLRLPRGGHTAGRRMQRTLARRRRQGSGARRPRRPSAGQPAPGQRAPAGAAGREVLACMKTRESGAGSGGRRGVGWCVAS